MTDHSLTESAAPPKITLNISQIMDILPHRPPFLLIDRVIDLQPGESIVAIKNVTMNEAFFPGHFPAAPVMPGALIVEALAQTGGTLLLYGHEERHTKLFVFAGIEKARFRRPVVPGDQLRLEARISTLRPTAVRVHGTAYVGDKRVVDAIVSCRLVETAMVRGDAQDEDGGEE